MQPFFLRRQSFFAEFFFESYEIPFGSFAEAMLQTSRFLPLIKVAP